MSASQLITRLRSLGVSISASGGRLRLSAGRGGLTDQVKQAVAQEKPALLELLAQESNSGSSHLVPVPRIGRLPLSSFQERLWVLHRLEPENTAYNMVTAWPQTFRMNAFDLEKLIRTVVQENEILRCSFGDDDTGSLVKLLPADVVRIERRDLQDRDQKGQEAAIREDIDRQTHLPFDLGNEAPARFVVYQVAADRFVVLVAAHHIIMDEWSLTLLRRRIERPGMADACVGALQYVDYAAWQRRTQSTAAIAGELEWWERQLADIPPLCTFPADRIGTTGEVASGRTRPFCWDATLVQELRAFARRQGVTIYMVLLAVCAAVLSAHAGLADIVLGSPMGTRDRAEFETMIGPFVSLLVLRLKLDDDPSFNELLTRARDVVLDAHEHRQVPFELLVDRLAPPRSFDRPPLVQVAVVLHNATDEMVPPIYSGGAVLDLTWYAKEIDGRIEGSIEYRDDLYEAATIDRILARFETFLRESLRDPARSVSDIPLTGAEEREWLLAMSNATHQDPAPAAFPIQFERLTAAHPDRLAVVFGGEALSYGELNRRANRLARLLRDHGVATGHVVGVCVERSLEMVVALFAIQKSGATYVPLDPRFPSERLRSMIADSGMLLLVASQETGRRISVPDSVAIIDPATHAADLAGMDTADLANKPEPDDIAYIIYTSGSTGRPKGVRITHRALANFLAAMRREPGFSESDILAAVTTVSFDIAALELYLPLVVGARIELVPHEAASDGSALSQLLDRCGATVLQATPATFRLLVEADWHPRPDFRALCGGETLPRDLADSLLSRVHELWNLYGPTETTIWSTVGRVEPGADIISIGRPIVNTSVYILGSTGAPMGVGIPGEICIAGAGVAVGYHGRPELTAERFVADPFAPHPGARMYRTGDLGRWTTDGRLIHMGRMDRQVKLRGFRIELQEIEAALLTHPAVMRAVVVAYDLTTDHPRLVAYVVYEIGKDLTVSEVRRHLRRILPDYMVPSVFVAIDKLPLTPNGKVDVKALVDPLKSGGYADDSHVPPAPGLEQTIADIWRDVLHVPYVGAEDNFFEVGGSSLLAIRVIAAIEARTGARLPPRLLFFHNLRHIAAAARPALAERSAAG